MLTIIYYVKYQLNVNVLETEQFYSLTIAIEDGVTTGSIFMQNNCQITPFPLSIKKIYNIM